MMVMVIPPDPNKASWDEHLSNLTRNDPPQVQTECAAVEQFLSGQSTAPAYAGTADGFSGAGYARSAVLDPAGNFRLHWTLDEAAGLLSAAFEVETDGWAGLGFGDGKGSMTGADLFIGGAGDDQTAYFSDRVGRGNFAPPADAKQSCFDIKVWGASGATVPPPACDAWTCTDSALELRPNPADIVGASDSVCCQAKETSSPGPSPPAPPVRGIDGTAAGEWAIKAYSPLAANPGDVLKFVYTASHDVFLFDNEAAYLGCDFTGTGSSIGALDEGAGDGFLYTIPSSAAGQTLYFSCERTGHCLAGQKQSVVVSGGAMPACDAWTCTDTALELRPNPADIVGASDSVCCQAKETSSPGPSPSPGPVPPVDETNLSPAPECTDVAFCNGRGIALEPAHSRNTSGVCFCECVAGWVGDRCQDEGVQQQASEGAKAAPLGLATLIAHNVLLSATASLVLAR
jgi:hypothetical protein